ncbi:MAG: PepSY-associated TM helix domain-containing protein [Pirellulales bacterium]
MRLRKLNNILHRDFGYFFTGTTILYAISGLAVNHIDDWDPNFIIHHRDIQVKKLDSREHVTTVWITNVLESLNEHDHYRSHDFPTSSKVKIYLDDGSVFINFTSGTGEYETVRRRPLLYQMNSLHLSPKKYWLAFSDLFCVSLLLICITGLFVLRGRNGITGRGAILAGAGIIVPLIFLLSV